MKKTLLSLSVAAALAAVLVTSACEAGNGGTTPTTATPVAGLNVYVGTTLVANGGTGEVPLTGLGTESQAYLTLSNAGNAELSLNGSSRVIVTGTGFSCDLQPSSDTIAAGGTAMARIAWDASTTGTNTGTVIISNDSTVNPYSFTVQSVTTNLSVSGPTALSSFAGIYRGMEIFDIQTNVSTNISPNDTTNIGTNSYYTLPVVSLMSTNYASDFHGTDTIADLAADIQDGDTTLTKTYTVKGILSAVVGYKSVNGIQTGNFYIQDTTGGIYFYTGEVAIGYTNLGQIVEATIPTDGCGIYHELYQITSFDSVTVRSATAGEPTSIYVKDILTSSSADVNKIVRFAGTISQITNDSYSNPYYCFENANLPNVKVREPGLNDLGFGVGDDITVIAPLSTYDGGVIDIYYSPNLRTSDYITNAVE